MENNLVITSTNNKENTYYTGEWDSIDINLKRINILLNDNVIDSYLYNRVKRISLNGYMINIK